MLDRTVVKWRILTTSSLEIQLQSTGRTAETGATCRAAILVHQELIRTEEPPGSLKRNW